MRKYRLGFAAFAVALTIISGGAEAETPRPPATLTKADDDRRAGALRASAQAALARADAAGAVRDAEAAALIAPRQAETRALLGRAYLAAGRFASAETALSDALSLDPGLRRVALSLALVRIALGRDAMAEVALAQAEGGAPEADMGLALALLGHANAARQRLLAAARAPGADARIRQNLAFAYALEGRWNDAAAVAAQDVPADRMAERLRRWAMIAQLGSDRAMQVGALLGTLPAEDAGQPPALALVDEPAETPVLAEVVAPPAVSPPLIRAKAFTGPPRMRVPGGDSAGPGSMVPPPPMARPDGSKSASNPGRFVRSSARISTAGRGMPAVQATLGGRSVQRLRAASRVAAMDWAQARGRIDAGNGPCLVRWTTGKKAFRWTVRRRSGQTA